MLSDGSGRPLGLLTSPMFRSFRFPGPLTRRVAGRDSVAIRTLAMTSPDQWWNLDRRTVAAMMLSPALGYSSVETEGTGRRKPADEPAGPPARRCYRDSPQTPQKRLSFAVAGTAGIRVATLAKMTSELKTELCSRRRMMQPAGEGCSWIAEG